MGYLMIDHRNGQNPDGSRGTLEEWDTVSCKHCQKVIKIYLRGLTKEVGTKHTCQRCSGPICNECAGIMQKIGQCPGPFIARVEAEMQKMQRLDDFQYAYRSCTR